MAQISITKENIHGWDGYRLKGEDVTLGVVPQVGGRIMSLTHRGEELFFVQEQYRGQVFNLSKDGDVSVEKKKLGFRFWGGDKTWVAPQDAWWEEMPPLDLDSGTYACTVKDSKIEMISPVCRETGLQIIRQIEMKKDETIHLNQIFINESKETIQRGIWDVTQLRHPFEVIVPASKENIKAYRDDGLKIDASHKVSELFYSTSMKEPISKIVCDDRTHFKFKCIVRKGALVSLKRSKKGPVAFTRTFFVDKDAEYAHEGAVEVYNSNRFDYGEVEVHSPLFSLEPGGRYEHAQVWQIKRLANEQDFLNIKKIFA
jgi:hypothetical protein